MLGWVIGVVVTLMGLGAVWLGGWKPCQEDETREVKVKALAPETASAPEMADEPETAGEPPATEATELAEE